MKLCQGCFNREGFYKERGKKERVFCNRSCQFEFYEKEQEKERNANCKESCMTLVAIRKYSSNTILSDFTEEIICSVAKYLWKTRRDATWYYGERIHKCQNACLTLLVIGKKYKLLPKDLVIIIAKHLWNTRREPPWETKQRYYWELK